MKFFFALTTIETRLIPVNVGAWFVISLERSIRLHSRRRTSRHQRQSKQALAAWFARARYDIVIVSDSDVRVEPEYLRAIAGPFRHPKVGAVTCLYRGITDGSLSADLRSHWQ